MSKFNYLLNIPVEHNSSTYVAPVQYIDPIPFPEQVIQAAARARVTPQQYLEARAKAAEYQAKQGVISQGKSKTPEEKAVSDKLAEKQQKKEQQQKLLEQKEQADAIADEVMSSLLSLTMPSTYINGVLSSIGQEPLNVAESLGVDLLIGGGIGYLGKVGKFTQTANRLKYIDPYKDVITLTYKPTGSKSAKTSLRFFEKPSKITELEKLGLPKIDRNQIQLSPTSNFQRQNIRLKNENGDLVPLFTDSEYPIFNQRVPDNAVYYVDNTAYKNTIKNKYILTHDPFSRRPLVQPLTRKQFSPAEDIVFFGEKNSDKLKDISNILTDYAKTLPEVTDRSLFIDSDYINNFINYYYNLGYDISKVNPVDLLKIVQDNYKQLYSTSTGKLSGRVFWNGSPNKYMKDSSGNITLIKTGFPDTFEHPTTRNPLAITSLSDNTGVYFGTQPFAQYGFPTLRTRSATFDGTRFGLTGFDMQPYVLNDIKQIYSELPKGLNGKIPANSVVYSSNNKGNRTSNYEVWYPDQIAVGFGSKIKSLFPHPKAFVINSDGSITLNRTWSNNNLHYKQGGKMNYLEYLKQGSKIHIKKSHRGQFTKYCKGTVTEECIKKGKNSLNPKIRKQATFADNARHWVRKGSQGFSTRFEEIFGDYIPYTIQSGDSIYNVANKFGVSVGDILSSNDITNKDLIAIGDKIKIPKKQDTVSEDVDTGYISSVNPIHNKGRQLINNIDQQLTEHYLLVGAMRQREQEERAKRLQIEPELEEVVAPVETVSQVVVKPEEVKIPSALKDRMAIGMRYLMSKGFSKEAAAGVIGVFTAESGLRPGILNTDEDKKYGLSAGRGIAQWSNSRRKEYEKYFNGTTPTIESELDYFLQDLNKYSLLKDLKSSDLKTAVQLMTRGYEAGTETALASDENLNQIYGQAYKSLGYPNFDLNDFLQKRMKFAEQAYRSI